MLVSSPFSLQTKTKIERRRQWRLFLKQKTKKNKKKTKKNHRKKKRKKKKRRFSLLFKFYIYF